MEFLENLITVEITVAAWACPRCARVYVGLKRRVIQQAGGHWRHCRRKGPGNEIDRLQRLLQECLEVFELCHTRKGISDPVYDPAIEELSRSLGGGGYGAIMDAASHIWARGLEVPGGQHTVGPCEATVEDIQKKIRESLHQRTD